MKKRFLFVLLIAAASSTLFAQKVPISWVKTYVTQPYDRNGAGIKFVLWYPQVDSCLGAEKINRFLKNARRQWSDSKISGPDKNTGGSYEETNTVFVTYNKNGLLSFNKYWGYSLSKGRANDGYNYGLTFDTKTGNVLKTDDFIDQAALGLATALQSDDNCFLTADGLTIPDQDGNQEFSFKQLKPFAKKRWSHLFK